MSTDRAVDVALLSAGWDRPYTYGLTTALVKAGVRVELVAGNDLSAGDFNHAPSLTMLNLRESSQPGDSFMAKARRMIGYYLRLVAYAWRAKPRRFHILWNNRYDVVDRVVLMAYYRLLGRSIYLTAHNVNAGARDERDTFLNRLTLQFQYRLCRHIFVHTDQMKKQMVAEFGVEPDKVTVVPFGINNAVPHTGLMPAEARARLGLATDDRVLLFFGNIAPYKGLEYLAEALPHLLARSPRYRLVVAGPLKPGADDYWRRVEQILAPHSDRVLARAEFIPDEDVEIYCTAADVLVLPYVHIFQSGVLFLGFSFGLPALVADVGSLTDDVVEGENGFAFQPRDVRSLVDAVSRYFDSPLAQMPDAVRRQQIIKRAEATHSWDTVAATTVGVYTNRNMAVSR